MGFKEAQAKVCDCLLQDFDLGSSQLLTPSLIAADSGQVRQHECQGTTTSCHITILTHGTQLLCRALLQNKNGKKDYHGKKWDTKVAAPGAKDDGGCCVVQ